MTRIAIYHRYEYPNWKSRLKTYFLKLAGIVRLINGKPYFINLYGGEIWQVKGAFTIGEDEVWKYELEILQKEWCKQIEILIIKELKR